ncbi:MAG: BON domain-containing protein [Planctomycetes bacterium]|nr:BON domain-containing protein [Planctomycetota bacterium]
MFNSCPNLCTLAEGRLRSLPYAALKQISCEDHQGVLTLRGCVPTYYLKQVAQEAVAQVPGVERIENRIAVLTSGRAAP